MSSLSKKDSILITIINDWKLIWRTIFLLSALLIMTLSVTYGVLRLFKWVYPVTNVEITPEGAYILRVDEKKTVHWMFSSAELWANSGIEVEEGDVIEVTASGRFNTGIHHLFRYGIDDTSFAFPWVSPDGITVDSILRPADRSRYPDRIITTDRGKDVPIGKLLMQIVPYNSREPEIRPKSNPLYVIGTREKVRIKDGQSGFLYFTVNEIPLDSTREQTYLITPDEDPKYCPDEKKLEEQRDSWKIICKKKDFDIWYKDNVGSIFVSIEFN